MKMTTGILGCALAAGLMTFAPSQSKAGVVGTDGVLYSPINLKLTISYLNDNDKIQKKTVNSKTVLTDLGYNSSVVLALGQSGDVVVINKKSGAIISNLTTNGIMSVSPDEYLSTSKNNGNKGGYTDTSAGTIEVYFDYETESSTDYFDVYGSYNGKETGSSIKNGVQNVSTSAKATNLAGEGLISEIYDGYTVVTGSASVKGSGKLDVLAE